MKQTNTTENLHSKDENYAVWSFSASGLCELEVALEGEYGPNLGPNFYSKPWGISRVIHKAAGKDRNTAPDKEQQKNRHEDIFLLYPTEYRKGTESQHVLCITAVIPHLYKQSIFPHVLS